MKRIAIVIDSSGSMADLVKLYALESKLIPIKMPLSEGGFLPEKLEALVSQFDKVYLFTDGLINNLSFWTVLLESKIEVVKVE